MSRFSTQRRDSSGSAKSSTTSSPRSQRPRLLRSSATTPAVTASSSEIQASLVAPNSPHTAADLLNKMAYVPASYYLPQTAREQRSEPVNIERERSSSAEEYPGYTLGDSVEDGCYFSFPNFDNWESQEGKQESEKGSYT